MTNVSLRTPSPQGDNYCTKGTSKVILSQEIDNELSCDDRIWGIHQFNAILGDPEVTWWRQPLPEVKAALQSLAGLSELCIIETYSKVITSIWPKAVAVSGVKPPIHWTSGPVHSLKITEQLSARQKGCSPFLRWCVFKLQMYNYKIQHLGASICMHSLTQFTAPTRRWCHQLRHIIYTSFSRGRIYTFLENVGLAKSVESEQQRPKAGTNYSLRVKSYSCVVCDQPKCERFSTFCAV